nr:uroporphyrinogen decarboxylase [Anaerolineae bacterium]
MNKRERLQATIRGEPADRVAVALWRHWPGDDQRPEDQAAAHIAFQKQYDWDFVKVSPSSSFCISDWGVADSWVGNIEGTRTYQKRVIDQPEDWLSLKVLDPEVGSLGRQLKCLEILSQAFGTDVPFIQTIFNPLSQAKNLAGQERLLLHARQNAGQVHYALQTIADTTVRFIQAARSRGISGVYFAVQHASYHVMSEAEYQVFGIPYDKQVLSAIDDLWLNVLHLHGPDSMFKLLSDYPVQVVNWHDRVSPPGLTTGLKKIKGAASGGVDRDALHKEDPAEFIEQARDAYQQTGGKRWILGTGCVALVTTPVGNIRRFRALADEFIPGK